MKKERINKRTMVTLIIAFTLVALAGCSSAQNAEPKEEAKVSTEEVAETKVEEKAEIVGETTTEPTAEPTTEPTPEPVVYEGIDMESTLSGVEWVKTFEGIIDEPKMVIFNDSTNKKVIVENGAEVDFAKGDSLGIYVPNGHSTIAKEIDNNSLRSTEYTNDSLIILSQVSGKIKVGNSFVVNNILEVDGVEVTLTATLTLIED